MWFYPPKEKPDKGFVPIGKWRPSRKGDKEEWSYPPKPVGKVEDKREFKELDETIVGFVKKELIVSQETDLLTVLVNFIVNAFFQGKLW